MPIFTILPHHIVLPHLFLYVGHRTRSNDDGYYISPPARFISYPVILLFHYLRTRSVPPEHCQGSLGRRRSKESAEHVLSFHVVFRWISQAFTSFDTLARVFLFICSSINFFLYIFNPDLLNFIRVTFRKRFFKEKKETDRFTKSKYACFRVNILKTK